jgi:NAD(P)-dependent dehydrogenase (short-subunit alcohol dehydrogenase family)
MVLFTVSLSEKLASRGITSFSIHPGSKSKFQSVRLFTTKILSPTGIKTGLQKHMADPAVFQDILEYVKAQSNGMSIESP